MDNICGIIFTGVGISSTVAALPKNSVFRYLRSMGAYSLRTFLSKNNYEIRVVDYYYFFSHEQILQLISQHSNLKFIGFSCTLIHVDNDLVAKIKEQFAEIDIITGGANDSPFYNIKANLVDYVFSDFAEQGLLKYLDWKTNKGPKPSISVHPSFPNKKMIDCKIHYPYTDMSNLEVIWKESDCIVPGAVLPLEIGRGCRFKCAFCYFPLKGNKNWDYIRTSESLIEELTRNYNEFGVSDYMIIDSTFNDSMVKIKKFSDAVKQLPFKIRYSAWIRIDLVSAYPEMADLLIESGLIGASIGIESMNHNKNIGKGIRAEQIVAALKRFKNIKPNIKILANFIVGLPGESLEDIQKTYECVKNDCEGLIDFSSWHGLSIPVTTLNKSLIAADPKKYGYTMLSNKPFDWENEYMNGQTALELAKKYSDENMFTESAGGHHLLAYLNAGFSEEEVSARTPELFKEKFENLQRRVAYYIDYQLNEYKNKRT